jgi:hypothetical protein
MIHNVEQLVEWNLAEEIEVLWEYPACSLENMQVYRQIITDLKYY